MDSSDLELGQIFDHLPDAMILADPDTGHIVRWNRAATSVFGYSQAEALALPFDTLFPQRVMAQRVQDCFEYLRAAPAGGEREDTLLRVPVARKNGDEVDVELLLRPVGDANAGRDYLLTIV